MVLHDTGNFKIGDTLTEGEILNFKGIPSFSPEHFRYVNNADPMKSKQLSKGLDQLMDEGVAQLFTLDMNGRKSGWYCWCFAIRSNSIQIRTRIWCNMYLRKLKCAQSMLGRTRRYLKAMSSKNLNVLNNAI